VSAGAHKGAAELG